MAFYTRWRTSNSTLSWTRCGSSHQNLRGRSLRLWTICGQESAHWLHSHLSMRFSGRYRCCAAMRLSVCSKHFYPAKERNLRTPTTLRGFGSWRSVKDWHFRVRCRRGPSPVPSWVDALNRLHSAPYAIRYAENAHIFVLPSSQPMATELMALIDTVRKSIST
jgi:hypothetical protein